LSAKSPVREALTGSSPPASGSAARWAFRIVLASAFALLLWQNLPGHLTVDSVLALREGRLGLRETWNPAIYGWLLGISDRITPGAAALVGLSSALVFGSLALLPALRARTSWWAPPTALLVAGLPQLMLYPAIVWKDVLFSAAALAGFVVLAVALRAGLRRSARWGLALSALLIAAAGLLRQNGLIVAAPAALAIAWVCWPRGGRQAIGVALGWLAAVLVLTMAINMVARPQGVGGPDEAGAKGLRILQMYDIMGAARLQLGRPTPQIDRASPATGDYIRASAGRLYSAERVDVMSGDAQYDLISQRAPRSAVQAEWFDLVLGDPALYARVRSGVFRQVFATPKVDRCLPAHVGVVGPAAALASLGMAARHDQRDLRLYNYVTWHLDTPSMSHVVYAIIGLGVLALLMVRRDPADVVVAALITGALAFAASFFVISIACDYRYLYFLDLAAITGLLYWALDPRLSRSLVQKGVVELS
jgi:hypothetical protein